MLSTNSDVRSWYLPVSRTLFAAFAATTLIACGEEATEEALATDLSTLEVFVSPAQFEALRLEGALVLDGRHNPESFTLGRVPGAVEANWKDFVKPDENGIMLEETADLEEAARAHGVDSDRPVIIYGDGGSGDASASRLLWTLEYLGHDKVFLLDGGFDAWKTLGKAVASGPSSSPVSGAFTVRLRPELRATLEEVEAAIEGGDHVLLDSRTAGEFAGDDLRGNPWAGHLPEAVHYEWTRVFDEDGKLRDKEAIRAELAELGITAETKVIPYCQSGVRSTYIYAIFKWLGFASARNYDGSWWEWSRQTPPPASEDTETPADPAQPEG